MTTPEALPPSPLRGPGTPRTMNEVPEPVLGLPLDRAASLLPADLVQGDETIILLLKPSPLYIILGCLPALTGIGLITLVASYIQSHFLQTTSRNELLLIATLFTLVRIGWQFLEWMSRTYVLTDRRVIRIEGFVQVQVFQAELSKIQHIGLSFSVRERLFGLGTISFATAGTAFVEAYWVMLSRPGAVHRKIMQAMNRYR